MTYKEAKEVFLNRGFVNGLFDGNKWRQSIVVISEWLEQEPCEDAISREAVLSLPRLITDIDISTKTLTESVDIKMIESLPSVTPKPKTEWIPVSERLPERQGLYLVTIRIGDKYYIDTDIYNTLYKKGFRTPNIIAWMPLPEPYKPTDSQKE